MLSEEKLPTNKKKATGVPVWITPTITTPTSLNVSFSPPRVVLYDSNSSVCRGIEESISGVRAEQEGTFILLWDKQKPTGAMAGVRIMDGKVDLIFVNNRFAHKVRGIFRRVLNSKTAKEIRDLLGKEDFPNETLMGAKLLYEEKGFIVNFLDRSVNIEFCLGCSDIYNPF